MHEELLCVQLNYPKSIAGSLLAFMRLSVAGHRLTNILYVWNSLVVSLPVMWNSLERTSKAKTKMVGVNTDQLYVNEGAPSEAGSFSQIFFFN